MINQLSMFLSGGWSLLRLVAVVSSSITTVISSLLPMFLYTSFSTTYLVFMFFFLSAGALIFHGLLTHLFNDYADFLSGTDDHSPGILSGGSRVIQKGIFKSEVVWRLGKSLAALMLMAAVLLAIMGHGKISLLILVGVWAAASYSLPPLRLSYRPFLGEWLSLFPSIFFLGLAGPWLMLEQIPMWAVQNAVINALICMAWVMVHHIPDLEADQKAEPIKETTVVWFAKKFGDSFAYFPALFYLMLAGLVPIWLAFTRLSAAFLLIVLISVAIYIVTQLDIKDHHQVSKSEKRLLVIAMLSGIALGIF